MIKYPHIVSHSKIESSVISAILTKFKEKFKFYKKETVLKENEEISLFSFKVNFNYFLFYFYSQVKLEKVLL